MRLILMGSGEFGLPTFEQMAQSHQVALVISQPDKPAGRKRQLHPTPISQWASDRDLPLLRPDDVNDAQVVEAIAQCQADAAVVIAFGQKLSPGVIDAAGRLVVNLHASLLPQYRGAAPIQWAMIRGESQTGVTVISLAQRMDAGLIYAVRKLSIDPLATAGELHDQLAQLGPEAVSDVLERFETGTLKGLPQDDSQATRAPKLSKSDGWVDFALPADQVRSRIHGLTPWPGVKITWTHDPSGKPIERELFIRRVADALQMTHDKPPGTVLPGHCVACGVGAIRLLDVQPPGKRVMLMRQFAAGHSVDPGDMISSELHQS